MSGLRRICADDYYKHYDLLVDPARFVKMLTYIKQENYSHPNVLGLSIDRDHLIVPVV